MSRVVLGQHVRESLLGVVPQFVVTDSRHLDDQASHSKNANDPCWAIDGRSESPVWSVLRWTKWPCLDSVSPSTDHGRRDVRVAAGIRLDRWRFGRTTVSDSSSRLWADDLRLQGCVRRRVASVSYDRGHRALGWYPVPLSIDAVPGKNYGIASWHIGPRHQDSSSRHHLRMIQESSLGWNHVYVTGGQIRRKQRRQWTKRASRSTQVSTASLVRWLDHLWTMESSETLSRACQRDASRKSQFP